MRRRATHSVRSTRYALRDATRTSATYHQPRVSNCEVWCARSASVRRARMATRVTSARAMDAARTTRTRVAPRAGDARRGCVLARALGSGTVTRVARLGKNLTFIDILSTTAMEVDGDAHTRVMYAKCVEDVPKLVRAGAVIEFEWQPQSESGRARRDDGTYADARNISVKTAAPVHVVANATEKMLDDFYGTRQRVGRGRRRR